MLSSIGLIDTLCEVATLQSDIIRKQAYVIEQHKIIDSFAEIAKLMETDPEKAQAILNALSGK